MIKINNIERSPLKESNLLNLIEYYLNTEDDISITFDKRLTESLGNYTFDSVLERHILLISVRGNWYNTYFPKKKLRYSYAARKFIDTIIHELRHAQQRIYFGEKYYESDEFRINESFKSNSKKLYNSICEKDARDFAKNNLRDALRIYRCRTVPECGKK